MIRLSINNIVTIFKINRTLRYPYICIKSHKISSIRYESIIKTIFFEERFIHKKATLTTFISYQLEEPNQNENILKRQETRFDLNIYRFRNLRIRIWQILLLLKFNSYKYSALKY